MSSKLIVALDYPTVQDAYDVLSKLNDVVDFYKIGHQLIFSGGLHLARDILEAGKKVFLDAKLLDIPSTMIKAIRAIGDQGFTFVTVHSNERNILASLAEVKSPNLKILVVAQLTSADETGVGSVLMRAIRAYESGIDGVICSVSHADVIRKATDEKFLIVTPGIRLTNDKRDDQKRVATPHEAMLAGVDHIVVGRSITKAEDPKQTVLDILAQMRQ